MKKTAAWFEPTRVARAGWLRRSGGGRGKSRWLSLVLPWWSLALAAAESPVAGPGAGGVGAAESVRAPAMVAFTAKEEIMRRVEAARREIRSTGGAALRNRLGSTHYDGRYPRTEEPYLLEGAKELQRLGFRVAKFWFNPRGLEGYGFHSEWNIGRQASLVELARHPYYAEVFRMPFSVILLEVTALGKHGNQLWKETPAHMAEVERQMHDLTVHLLETYRQREVTFVLQNWEGDWVVRQGAMEKGLWPSADAGRRFDAMREWIMARQRGVERARSEVRDSKARVLHALEVNRVLESVKGVPTLITEVVPRVDVDLLSWSCYDGLSKVEDTWRGIEILRHHAKAGPDGRKPQVFIGEVGLPENEEKWTEEKVREWWEARLAVFLALDLPWIVHWELYCNEPKDGRKERGRVCSADELRGFWLLRPDGSLSHAGNYLVSILKGQGRSGNGRD